MRGPRSSFVAVLAVGLVSLGLPAVPTHAQGGSTISSLGEMAGFVGAQIQAFQPSKGGGAMSSEPFVREETSTTTVGGRTVTRQSSDRIVTATDRDTLTFLIERTERYAVPGATPEAAPFEVKDSGGVTVQVDTCPDEDGTITFRSVSNRGIAEERSETYVVDQRLLLDAEGSMTFELGGLTYRTTYRGRGLKVVVVPGDTPVSPPRVRIEGDLALRGRVSGVLGRIDCRGSFRATARIDPADDVSAQIVGEGDDRRLSVHLWTPDPDARIDFPMRCDFPTGVTRVPYSITMRDAWFIWSGLGTPVELPITGGTASDRKTAGAARYEGSLTLRREDPPTDD